MKTITVIAHPYADQTGYIDIPDDITSEEDRIQYIEDHWNDIKFNAPDLDYCGTDFETYADDE